jgi:hypothetical protein
MITFGAVLGKATPMELLWLGEVGDGLGGGGHAKRAHDLAFPIEAFPFVAPLPFTPSLPNLTSSCTVALEIPLYALNTRLAEILGVLDMGGSVTIHAFGAYFGLAASMFISKQGAGSVSGYVCVCMIAHVRPCLSLCGGGGTTGTCAHALTRVEDIEKWCTRIAEV